MFLVKNGQYWQGEKMVRYLIICENPMITIQIYIQKMVRYLILAIADIGTRDP